MFRTGMKELKRRTRQAALVVAAGFTVVCGIQTARAEDTALVIGINSYQRLGKNADLHGCVRDAEHMRDALKELGFKVTLLTDKKASRKDVEENLKRATKGLDSKDRFVFYFAGYGVSNVKDNDKNKKDKKGESSESGEKKKEEALLPADAQQDKDDNDLPLLKLHQNINKLPCAVKALILDTSFSGTLLNDAETKLRPRFFLRSVQKRTRLWQQSDPTNADTADAAILSGDTVLFSAAMKTQIAYEKEGDDSTGVFTDALLEELKSNPGRWQEAQARVTARVAAATASQQTPILVPISYLYRSVLSTTPAPPGPNDITLREVYNMSRPSASIVTLRNNLNKTKVLVAEHILLNANVGADGYLLLIGNDAKNRIGLVWPNPKKLTGIESAQVRKGLFSFPGDFFSDTPGDDHLKAFWFPLSARDAVTALVQALQGGGEDKGLTQLQKSQLSSVLFATSEMHTRIELPSTKP